jgi:alanine-glyoxylate transaminase / (R)-3-amino-2-methylpropionate-pyruvate transaminase
MIVDGKMQYLFDETGRRYLDVRTTIPLALEPESAAALRRTPRDALSISACSTCCAVQAFAGIVTVSVGHCHPKVNKRVKEQLDRLQHLTTIYLNNQISEYAKELAQKMPGNLKVRRQCAVSPHLSCMQHPCSTGTCRFATL